MMKIIIIGASFAGVACAMEARKLYPQAQITVLEAGEEVAYIPNSLAWSLASGRTFNPQNWSSQENLRALEIDLHLTCSVLSLDLNHKSLETSRGSFNYDRLVLAMGARSESNLIKGAKQNKVLGLKSFQQGQQAFSAIQEAQRIALVGGGPIGIEMSEACLKLGKEVKLFEEGPWLDFKQFDAPFTESLLTKMEEAGLDLYLNERVLAIEEQGANLSLETNRGRYSADLVLLAVNFRSNSQLLTNLLDLHLDGRVLVDSYLRSSAKDIFAVGDLAYLPTQQTEAYTPLISTAIRTGQVAAWNLLGPRLALPPLLRLVGYQHFGLYRLSVGLIEEEILDQQAVHLHLQKERELLLQTIWSRESGVLLGLQAMGEKNCLALGNLALAAIRGKRRAEDLVLDEFLFAPQDEALGYYLHQAALAVMREREDLCY
ncbi:NAD(P)/FAD-dependent oxidoreductase [Streptococcus oricebi]|uniref:FAD/NAD(P)-binding domain-containing protein n=1 Tax=Streptococcus oricebi TaxID=1547447 RepID=A0ABS5B605_9STRE|nr:FAD-dependent oxidoreductase [Streptococcus oricebi]MBP2624279.1 hypothetical protein [Streptococcus oricebi]